MIEFAELPKSEPLPKPAPLPEQEPLNVAVIRTRDKRERFNRQRVRQDPAGVVKEYFGFDYAPFHENAIRQCFAGGKFVKCWPTGYAKSTVFTFHLPLLSLMDDPDEAHIICGVNINDSKRRLAAIQREIETNTHLIRDYPWIAKPKDKTMRLWSALQMVVDGRSANKPNASVVASAIGSNDIKGRRGKLIMDDIEGEDVRRSPWKREQLRDFVQLEAVRCWESGVESKRPLALAAGTPYDPNSIYMTLENYGWEAEYIKAFDAEGNHVWNHPDVVRRVDQLRRQLNKRQQAIAFMMDPTAGDPGYLSYEQIRAMALSNQLKIEAPSVFVSIDPAGGMRTGRRNDYAGIAVVKIEWPPDQELPQVDVLHARAFEQGIMEQVDLCADLARTFGEELGVGVLPIIYESNSQQGHSYPNVFGHTQPSIKLIPHLTTHANKIDDKMGITVIKTLLRNGRLHLDEAVAQSDGGERFLQEITDLGSDQYHDHISAAVWFVVYHAYKQVRLYHGPAIINGWQGWSKALRLPYDPDDHAAIIAAANPQRGQIVNGWAIQPYARWR